MRSRRLTEVIRSIGRRFSGTRVLVEPFVSPDGGRDIHWWLYVIDVPARWRYRIQDFATRKGCEVYGSPSRIPFFLSVHTVRKTPATVSWWEERMRRFREWRSARGRGEAPASAGAASPSRTRLDRETASSRRPRPGLTKRHPRRPSANPARRRAPSPLHGAELRAAAGPPLSPRACSRTARRARASLRPRVRATSPNVLPRARRGPRRRDPGPAPSRPRGAPAGRARMGASRSPDRLRPPPPRSAGRGEGAGLVLLGRFRRRFEPSVLPVVARWLTSTRCDSWASVDALCSEVIWPLLESHPVLLARTRRWASSPNRWVRRASLVALVLMARRGERLPFVYSIALRLLADDEDLVQKPCGWLLREAGKTDPRRLEAFLRRHGPRIPRTTLRYAIERFPAAKRAALLVSTRTGAG